jgi:hypothetical protein
VYNRTIQNNYKGISMLYDNLKDIIKHTHSLGFIEAVKISGVDGATKIESMSDDRSVVMNGKLKSSVSELDDKVVGFSRMAVLNGLLSFPGFQDSKAKVGIATQTRSGVEIPCEVSFDSGSGHKASYRFMSREAIEESLRVPPFKGATWNVVVAPTKANLKDLAYFSGVLGGIESTFTVVAENGNLDFLIGTGPTDRSVVPIATDIQGEMKHQWSWPLVQVLAILKLSESSTCEMSFSDMGALKIYVDSGLGEYEYILPAKSK